MDIILLQPQMNIKDLESSETHEVSQAEELLVREKEIKGYKEQFDRQAFQKKKQFLSALKEENAVLVRKIKEFNEKVDKQVSSLTKKIVPKKKFVVPVFEEMETKMLRDKFQEFERLRKEIQTRRSGTDSLEFLQIVKKKYEIRLAQLNHSIADKKKDIQHMKKIKKRSESEASIMHQEVTKMGELDIFTQEIQDLKQKVQNKSQGLRAKKQEFLSLYKQNRSNKSIVIESPVKEQKNEEEDLQLATLKLQYETLGKRVDALRLKKSTLQDQLKLDIQQTKQLHYLKARHTNPLQK